jgi:glycosyltransferase involved in cell wall biosynthesis
MRVFVVDHNCILRYGHNAKSVKLYTDHFQKLGYSTTAFVPQNYIGTTATADRVLRYPYSHLLEPEAPGVFERRRINRFANKVSMAFGIDAKLVNLRMNWSSILEQYHISSEDLIFFPSTDFYGAYSLIQRLMKQPKAQRLPRIHMRFIGVMENHGYRRPYPRLDLIKLIKSSADRLAITASAETPNYATYLETLLRQRVSYFPYPLFAPREDAIPNEFIVSSPGSGRADKGFFDTLAIAKEVYAQNPSANIVISTQDMLESDKHYDRSYSKALANFPNIKLKASRLSDDEIDTMMKSSASYFLPYSPGTYRQRGSAIFQEAISYGKSVIAKKGTGFAELVARYNVGYLADTPADFARSIQHLYQKFQTGDRIKIDRGLYSADLEQATLAATEISS